ncbi:MAG: Disulfide bond formation protein C [candidate division WS6 bacterium OLB20]|uniref:Disulfide bond formation protein C n=1 Tax=candidate division WS6 bacterium OLB20 TaxID=1617426 RepID=A0A136M168_9BACT|nr:MAG: Disulfide bond formation protein C [candidate division WS6 bacterium OLB20]
MKKLGTFLKDYYLYLIILISWTGTLGSLYMSEVMTLPPCDLCWYQRALLYPVALISITALFIKDSRAHKYYIMVLSLLGMIVSGYHYLYQLQYKAGNYNGLIPCDPNNPCGETQLELLGFITIPLMSFTAFALITGILLLVRYFSRKKS